MADHVRVRVPANIGVLSSDTGERIPGGSVGHVTAREAKAFGLEEVKEKPTAPSGGHGKKGA